jgi:hypothetical protein
VQIPALPKMTLLRIGVRLSEKDTKKYLPRWTDARQTQGLTYVERPEEFMYLGLSSRTPLIFCMGRRRDIHAGEEKWREKDKT